MSILLFYLVIFITNIIQGITGFAGTILAMPISITLVGYSQAKPVLNGLGLLAGVYILILEHHHVQWQLVKKIVRWMSIGLGIGLLLKNLLHQHQGWLLWSLGALVIFLAIKGFYQLWRTQQQSTKKNFSPVILLLAGIVHALFVSGGPLLVSLVSGKTTSKQAFRATLAVIWIILNGVLLVTDIYQGLYTPEVWQLQVMVVPFWLGGMILGSWCSRYMSQRVFLVITYLLLLISGLSIFLQ